MKIKDPKGKVREIKYIPNINGFGAHAYVKAGLFKKEHQYAHGLNAVENLARRLERKGWEVVEWSHRDVGIVTYLSGSVVEVDGVRYVPEGRGCVPGDCPVNVRRDNDAADRDALLELADDLDYAGANIENVACIDHTFRDSARRIREAVGE